ncbi:MAG: class I SAM-dependent methyltransferase [Gammaproteobacteria bacterium]|nr:class I SAM-dependent methyltransferase [Gammaproteobacteria bacterium]
MNKAVEATKIKPVAGEPWVYLDTGKDLEKWNKEDEIAYNQATWQTHKLALYAQMFHFFRANEMEGDYYEFGCHRARTFRMALTEARRHNLENMQFLAFDSFAGLPELETPMETRHSLYAPGALCTTEEEFRSLIQEHGIYVDRCRTIKGFYKDSLTKALQNDLLTQGSRIGIVNIDCDLYGSAMPVFEFIDPLLQEGSIIYIDDYFVGFKGSPTKGPAGAFSEYCKKSHFKFIEYQQIGWQGRSFVAYIE